jgi:hypothetical protein
MTRDEKYAAIASFVADFGPVGVSAQEVGDALYSQLKEPARGKPPTKPENERALEWARRNLRRCADRGLMFYDNRSYRWVRSTPHGWGASSGPSEPEESGPTLDTLREQSPMCRGALAEAEEQGSVTLPGWLLTQLLEEALRVGSGR